MNPTSMGPTQPEQAPTKPNGPVAAAFLAAGIGSLALGLFVILNKIVGTNDGFLRWDTSFGVGSGVGPLSGKVGFTVIVYLVAWGILAYLWRGKEVDFRKTLIASLVLVGLGFLFTFPPVFLAFES